MSRFLKLVGRALRLVCPVCGRGPLFRGLLTMHDSCSSCGAKFEREPGFFLGSIYINYGITAVVTLAGYMGMMFAGVLTETQRMVVLISVAILLPILLHRHARSLWLGFDQWHDPRPNEE